MKVLFWFSFIQQAGTERLKEHSFNKMFMTCSILRHKKISNIILNDQFYSHIQIISFCTSLRIVVWFD